MAKKKLTGKKFTDDDKVQVLTDLLALKKTRIAEFLARVGLARSGTKEAIRSRIEEALCEQILRLNQVVEFLDEVVPWGKQHVCLYKGPRNSIGNWRRQDWFAQHLRNHRMGRYLNASVPLALPDKITVSSVEHDGRRLRVTAVKRRDWWERDDEYDAALVTADGNDVELRAFIHRVTRNLVAFEWDLISNTAILQISQLPRGIRYEDVANEFFDLISGWLDIGDFSLLDLRPAIKKLHEMEENGHTEIRSHGIKYRSLQGRKLDVRSPSPTDSVLGEAPIDAALGAVRAAGVGHLGNFYWLPPNPANGDGSPLDDELHVVIVGTSSRINFPTPNVEPTVRYVLSRIRSHCA